VLLQALQVGELILIGFVVRSHGRWVYRVRWVCCKEIVDDLYQYQSAAVDIMAQVPEQQEMGLVCHCRVLSLLY
jgi:hypothetical protein